MTESLLFDKIAEELALSLSNTDKSRILVLRTTEMKSGLKLVFEWD
jgi:hypothetical protein